MPYWISTPLSDTPPSINTLPLDTLNPKYRRIRNQWQQDVAYLFNEASNKLPRDLSRVKAHAVLTFNTTRRRDSGNYNALCDKWLGDVLQTTGRLADDTHDVYSFAGVIILTDPTVKPNHFLIIQYETGASNENAEQ